MRIQLNFGNIQNVKHIFHIADIHIRLLNRHTEYKEVFKRLYDEINNTDKETIVFIGGDIVHNKTDVTNELVDLVYDFLSKIVTIRPVILIKGNHDLNVNNQNRKSILDVVVPMINNPLLNYIDDYSSVYYFNNLDFILYPFINNDLPAINHLNSNNIKIGMFHGCINGCKTDGGMLLESDINLNRFKDVDILLLGDIHKYQVLSKQNPIAIYPGSLIQQDYGETINNHGYVLWDIQNLSYKHFEIKNDYGFYNLYLNYNIWNEKIEKLKDDYSNQINNIESITKPNVNLKIKFNQNDILSIDEIKKDIISKLKNKNINILECCVNNISENKIVEIQNKINIHSINSQIDLLENYFKINNYDFSGIEDIHNEQLKNINFIKKQSNIWRPVSLSFSNLFSYGKDNYINFNNMKGSYGLFAPNTFGKSSIMEIISFVCFNRTSKSNSINKIMNINSDNFSVEFIFENNNNYYKIERKGERKKDKVKMSINFYSVDEEGNIIEDLTEGKNDIYNEVKRFIGNYEDFVLTTLSLQTNNSNFIDKTQSQRKELIQQFLELDLFDKLYQSSNQKVNEYKTALKTLETKYNNDYNDYKSKIQKLIIDKQSKEIELDVINNNILNTEIKIKTLTNNIKDVGNFDLNEINKKKDLLNKEIDNLDNKIKNNVDEILNLESQKRSKISNIILGIDYDIVDKNLNDYNINNNTKTKILNEIKSLKDYLKIHSDLHFNNDCNDCNFNKEHFNINETNNKLNVLEIKLNDVDSLLLELEKSFMGYNYEFYNLLIKNNKDLEQQIINLDNKITNLSLTNKTYETEFNLKKYQLDEVNTELEKYEASILLFENNNKILNDIQILEDELSILKSKKKPIEQLILQNSNDIIRYETKDEELQKLTVDIEELKIIYNKYYLYNNAVSKNGIVLSLFKDVIPYLENETNLILGNVSKFKCKFELDGTDIDCYIDYGNGNKWDVSTISGMERFITSLAIRIALINVSQLPRSNFMCIDEGFGVLDKSNMNELSVLFSYFKNIFDFYIIISHIEQLKDFVDDILIIERDGMFSKINYK